MRNHILYSQINEHIECIYYRNATLSYPLHTHTGHVTFGYILEGKVFIVCGGEKKCYHTGEHFCIPPDISHAIETVDDTPYSMVCLSVAVDKVIYEDGGKAAGKVSDGDGGETAGISLLKQMIFESPQDTFPIKKMAHCIGISPYHMIRQFKAACGLTPHQFQIQCRVRKAQKLLEQGESVIEAAYATGFCDQSHFDRCFQKIVRLTPREYKRCLLQ